MGLDNIWIKSMPEGQEPPAVTFDPPLALAVGMLTDPANSFRGKCYAGFVQEVAGVDLYEDLSNESVLEVAAALERYVADLPNKDVTLQPCTGFDPDLGCVTWLEFASDGLRWEAIKDLARMFRAFGDAGHMLVAWF